MWRGLGSIFGWAHLSEEKYRLEKERLLGQAPVPVFWLFGKTGSGKTTVVKYLTGAESAEIGTGFRPQTRRTYEYEFPTADHHVLRFLDTRGLGEIDYDPQEDITRFSADTHLMIVTARAMDHAQAEVLTALRKIRDAQPHRPVLLALTSLHEAYPHRQHQQPDPFLESDDSQRLPESLRRSIQRHREQFAGMVDRVVPIDLTPPEDGYDPPDFGGERLKAALVEMLPAAYRQTLLNLDDAMRPLKSLNDRRAMPYVISYSTLAATAAASPIPWIDIPVVLAIQSHLVYRLGKLYGQKLDSSVAQSVLGAVGGRLATQMAVRETLKLMPVVGLAANAALAYVFTFGLGKAACWYFGQVRAGNAPTEEDVRRVWNEQISIAERQWQKHRAGEHDA